MSVYFAFYVGKGDWRDKIIRWATRSHYSHVEMITDDKLELENWTISASKRDGAQVREKLIKWKPENWEFWELPTDHSEYIKHRALKYNETGYDTLGALLTVTPINWHSKVRWFCSELMANAVGAEDPHLHTPGSFCDLLKRMGGHKLSTE